MGKHIRLTSMEDGRDIVEILELASAPCHPHRDCASSSDDPVRRLTEMVDELGKHCNWEISFLGVGWICIPLKRYKTNGSR